MTILLTGATGFIGRHLLRELLDCGHHVRCLVRDLTKAKDLMLPGVEIAEGDILNISLLENAVKGCHIVYHLAGNLFDRSWKNLYAINSLGTKNIYQMAIKFSVERFVYLSSIAAVGPQNCSVPIDERVLPNPSSRYGKSKFLAECFISSLHREQPITTIIVRPPLVYGDQSNPQSRISLLIKKLKEEKFSFIGAGQNEISLCDVGSLSSFLAGLANLKLERGLLDKVHVGHDETPTIERLVEIICHSIKAKIPSSRIPVIIAYMLGLVMDCIQFYSNQANLITTERVMELTGYWKVSNTKAKSWGFIEKTNIFDGLKNFAYRTTFTSER